MASPQKENGYTAIANEIMEALSRTRIPGEVRQMLDVIIRKTYGFNKKEDKISTSQFMEMTSLPNFTIHKARKRLLDMNMITITKKGNSQILTYSFQKDYHKWKLLPKKVTVTKKLTPPHVIINSKDTDYSGRECEICGQKEDNNQYVFHNHHVEWELDITKNLPISNKKSPTILVCSLCHDKIHNNEIKIDYNPKRQLLPIKVIYCSPKRSQSVAQKAIHNNNKDNITIESETKPVSPTDEVFNYFRQEYLSFTGNEYYVANWAKDKTLIKGLVRKKGIPDTKELIKLFFESNDKFIKESGYTIGVFVSQINKLSISPTAKYDNAL